MTESDQRDMLDTLRWYNQRHLEKYAGESSLEARLASYELAFRMQVTAPELADLSKERRPHAHSMVWMNPIPAHSAPSA